MAIDPNDPPATNGVAWRLHSLEQRMLRLESLEPSVIAERVNTHTEEFKDLREDIRSLRRALYTFSFSIAGAAVVFGIGVLQLVAS